jgi:outer membrane protein insertion porin family
MKWLLISLMLVSAHGFAQPQPAQKKAPAKGAASAPAPLGRWPIESIVIEGIRIQNREQVLAVIGLKTGQVAGRPEFEAARDRLVATGAFETVSYKFEPGPRREGYVATFQLTEVQQVYPVEFDDLHVSAKDLAASLQAKDPMFSMEKLPATQPVLQRYARWIEEYLAAKGVTEKISGSVTPSDPGDYMIVFRPARNLPAVAQIIFEGNKLVSQDVLWQAIFSVGIGLPYTEDAFRQVLRASIRPIYEARGRLRVSFPKIRTEPDKEVKGVNVFVTVDEGVSYELGKVSIAGSTPIAPETLLKAGEFKSGEVANMEHVTEGVERVRKAVVHAGYMQAKVESERKIDDERKAVDVVVRMDAGPQFFMGKLNIVGLDLDGEAEMKRIWTMTLGKPFNPDYPDLFLKRVREGGMFDDLGPTKSELKLNEREHTADVTLRFSASGPQQGRPSRRGRGRGGVLLTQSDPQP